MELTDSPPTTYHLPPTNIGFTIVELLVTVVVIGIIAALTIVAYNDVQKDAATVVLKTDLENASAQLTSDNIKNGSYPASVELANYGKGLSQSAGTVFGYYPTTTSYCLSATSKQSGNSVFHISSTKGVIKDGLCPPPGFIAVPGSATYGTSDFYVMKYEAKQVGATTVPISQAAGLPWVSISQTTAIANSPNVVGCTGCHLITEAEWMTIAQNVLSVASNWNGGVVGTSYIFSGHNDNAPANALAVTTPADGYSDTGNVSPSNQKRTLTLTNGEVIWDLAGNVNEWTSGTVTTGQPGVAGNAYTAWIQWPNVTTPGTLSPSVFPSGTGISGASSWTSANGIGQLLSNPADTVLRGFFHGGAWDHGVAAGVLMLRLSDAPGLSNTFIGFRVSR